MYTVINMHRRTDLWGPDGMSTLLGNRFIADDVRPCLALEFDPDCFLDDRLHRYLAPNPYIFCPFNAGPRICLGQQVREGTLVLLSIMTDDDLFFSLLIMKPRSSLFACYNCLPISRLTCLRTRRLLLHGLREMA